MPQRKGFLDKLKQVIHRRRISSRAAWFAYADRLTRITN